VAERRDPIRENEVNQTKKSRPNTSEGVKEMSLGADHSGDRASADSWVIRKVSDRVVPIAKPFSVRPTPKRKRGTVESRLPVELSSYQKKQGHKQNGRVTSGVFPKKDVEKPKCGTGGHAKRGDWDPTINRPRKGGFHYCSED